MYLIYRAEFRGRVAGAARRGPQGTPNGYKGQEHTKEGEHRCQVIRELSGRRRPSGEEPPRLGPRSARRPHPGAGSPADGVARK